ncbi:hypothetical protein RYX36_030936, partial [Vicia faba]
YTPLSSDRQEFYAAFIHCPFLVKLSLPTSHSSPLLSLFSFLSLFSHSSVNHTLLLSLPFHPFHFLNTVKVTTFQLQSLSLISSSITKYATLHFTISQHS